MFALDLFNTRYERNLREGAVDDLEGRRIDDLNAKMDDLIARAREAKTPEHKAGLKREFDKVKDERDSYFKIKDESMEYGSVEEAGIGQDLVTPQQRVKQSQPQKQTPVGKVVDTAKQAAKWLAGKGGPGKEGPTYEATAPGASAKPAPRAFGVGNFQRLVKANMGNRPYVDLEFANPSDNLKLDQAGLDLISDYYDGLETDQAKNHFIYRILPSADEVKTILTKLGWNSAGQQQLPLAEKKKFNSSSDLEAGDVKVARELQKLRAQYPAAKSDLEAVAKAELDGTERSQQQLAAIKGANEKQDALLQQLVSLDQEQGRELDDLDQENNTLEKRLARVQATNDRLQQTVSQIAGTKKADSKPDQTKADTSNKNNQDDDEEDVEPTIDIIPNAPVDNTPTTTAKPKAAPKKVYRKRKEKPSPGLGNLAQQLVRGYPTVTPDDTKTDTAVKGKDVAQEPVEPEDDVVRRPENLKSLRPQVATNADDFKLVAEQQHKLSAGDPVVVTAPNEFEGKTGEIRELSPSGKFVIVDLYNHGKHSMHLSDVEYNDYADEEVDEGWSDAIVAQRTGRPRTPYSVYIKGKKWKDFENDDHARAVMDKLKAKFKADGRDPDVITIAPTDIPKGVEEGKKKRKKKSSRSMGGYFFPGYAYYGSGDSGEGGGGDGGGESVKQIQKPVNELDINTLKSYADKRGAQVAAMKADNPDAPAGSPEWIKAAVPGIQVARAKQKIARKERQQGVAETALNPQDPAGDYEAKRRALHDLSLNKAVDQAAVLQRRLDLDKEAKAKGVSEAQTDYQKRRQRERDVDAGRTVKPVPKNPQTDYARKRAKERRDMELGEGLMKEPTNRKEYLDQRDKLFRMMAVDSNPANKQIIKQALQDLEARYGHIKTAVKEESSTSGEAVEIAIIRRVLVAHVDLIMEFGLDKVTQAIEEVAYNVGDVDEIGTSDVSAYVHQVKQILGVPEEVNEKWSQKYKSSINCANPKGFSQRAHCAGKKK